MRNNDIEKRLEILSKSAWTYKDIMNYYDIGSTRACEMKARAIAEFNGSLKYMSDKVKADSVLVMNGTSREREIAILKSILKGEMNVQNQNA